MWHCTEGNCCADLSIGCVRGNTRLPVTQKITLQCSIPMPFCFTVQVLRPHPYFRVEPLRGEIPAEGSVDIVVYYHPITLGTSATAIKVHIAQHGYEAIETLITARAISGALEQKSLAQAQDAVAAYAFTKGSTVNELLGLHSSFRGEVTLKSAAGDMYASFKNSRSFNQSNILVPGGPKNHLADPTALMLASTFRAHDLPGALDNALRTSLLGSKRKITIDSGALMGMNKVVGESVYTKKVRPRGPGSGAVFDAGAQWMSSQNMKRYKQLQKAKARLSSVPESDIYATVEGLRIPDNLDTVGTVSFVLTQETGKLKPKDLKAAIEKNRAEKKRRAEEQQKIREQGGMGSGSSGGLDVRSILSEERLNVADGDAFKRQLREMAFLADVDDVNKEEIEKTFRTSEEYLGSNQLSESDLQIVAEQRNLAARHAALGTWCRTLDRQRTDLFAPFHPAEKAGTFKPQNLGTSIAPNCITSLSPELSFDLNRNDVWAKRMNTQKRFISLVSKWIVQRRGTERLRKIKERLKSAGVTDRDSCRAFVLKENSERVRELGGVAKGSGGIDATGRGGTDDSVAALVCSMPNQALLNRMAGEAAVAKGPMSYSDKMVRRNLFPKYFMDQSGERTPLDSCDIKAHKGFDDRTLFQTKVRPEYVASGYQEFDAPIVPIFFPLCSSKSRREGAHEEGVLRPAADSAVKTKGLTEFLPPTLMTLAALMPPPPPEVDEKGKPIVQEEEIDVATPSWLAKKGEFTLSDINFSRPRPDLRIYSICPKRKETDHDWTLRPFGIKLDYDYDTSWGGSLLRNASGFASAHHYLLGAHEMRTGQDPPAASGPTLTDFYCPDTDRHLSGLNCFTRDHERTLTSRDPDIAPATEYLENDDILTDSESDDDDAYKKSYPVDLKTGINSGKPSLAAARQVLRAVPSVEMTAPPSPTGKGKKAAPAPAPTPVATATSGPDTANSMAESFALKDGDRRNDQVELMRDRKILDMQNMFKKQREKNANDITDRLSTISEGSKCQLFALRVQRFFHSYESSVYSEVERLLPEPQSLFVEPSRKMIYNQSMMLTGGTIGSPGKEADNITLQLASSP